MASCKFPHYFDEKPQYGVNWARNIYYELCRKYPRATELVRDLFSITDNEWIAFLVRQDKMWTSLRNLVHILDVRIRNNWNDGTTRDALLRWMSQYDVYWCDKESERRALTRLKKISNLCKQDVKGGDSRGVKETKSTERRGNLPSSSHSNSIECLPGQLELFDGAENEQCSLAGRQENLACVATETQ